MTNLTENDVVSMRAEAERLQLSGRELLENSALVMEECNGTGAEWMGMICGVIDTLNPAFTLPSCIHDLRYFIGGSDSDRANADREWLNNALVCVNDRYDWYNPMRYWERAKARKFYLALRSAGLLAWNSQLAEEV